MIEITKNEEKFLMKKFPGIKITTTRHKRYVEERRSILEQLPNNKQAIESLNELNRFIYENSNYDSDM